MRQQTRLEFLLHRSLGEFGVVTIRVIPINADMVPRSRESRLDRKLDASPYISPSDVTQTAT